MLLNSSSWLEIEQDILEQYSEKHKEDSKHEINEHKNFKATLFAIFLFIWSSISGSLMTLTCKLGYNYNPLLNVFDYMLIRSGAMIFSASIPVVWNKVSLEVKSEKRISLALYMIFNLTAMLSYYFGLKYLPAFKATLLFNLYPIFLSILGIVFLREIIKINEIIWILGAFVGVIVMVMNKSDGSKIEASFGMQIISCFLVIYWWIIYAISLLYIRIFTQSHSPLIIPFYYAITLSSFSVLSFLVFPSMYNYELYELREVMLFIVSGVFNILINMFTGYAFKYEEATTLAPFAYIGNILSLINDIFIFNYIFGITDILGAIIIISCLLLKIAAVKANKAK